MKLKSTTLALIAAGVVATGTACAVSNPSDWFHGAKPAVSSAVASSSGASSVQAAVAAAPIGMVAAPNYRAIVERYGPAVVGVNTEGTSKAAKQNIPGALENDPF